MVRQDTGRPTSETSRRSRLCPDFDHRVEAELAVHGNRDVDLGELDASQIGRASCRERVYVLV